MRKTLLLVVLAAWSCSAEARSADGGDAGDDSATAFSEEAEVRTFLESYYAAFSDRDWDRFADHFWPGATMTTVWTPPGESADRVVATTVPDFVMQAPEGPGSREVFEERMVSAEIDVRGNLAQAWARYTARFGDPPDIVEWQGMDAFTLMRHDGEWRVVSLAYLPETE